MELAPPWMALRLGTRWGQRLFNINGPSVRQLLISTRAEVASSQLPPGRNKTPANNGEIKWSSVLGPPVQPVTFERALMAGPHLSPYIFTSVKFLLKSTQNMPSGKKNELTLSLRCCALSKQIMY